MKQGAKIITKIEANPLLSRNNRENTLLRVAAYCRVSTEDEHTTGRIQTASS